MPTGYIAITKLSVRLSLLYMGQVNFKLKNNSRKSCFLLFLLSVRVVRIMSFAGVIPGKEIVFGTKPLKQAFCLDFHGT